jgi:hypothetical protein
MPSRVLPEPYSVHTWLSPHAGPYAGANALILAGTYPTPQSKLINCRLPHIISGARFSFINPLLFSVTSQVTSSVTVLDVADSCQWVRHKRTKGNMTKDTWLQIQVKVIRKNNRESNE